MAFYYSKAKGGSRQAEYMDSFLAFNELLFA